MFSFFSNATRCIGDCTAYLAINAGNQIMGNVTNLLDSCGLYPTNSSFDISGLPVRELCQGTLQAIDSDNFLSNSIIDGLKQLCGFAEGSELDISRILYIVGFSACFVAITVGACALYCSSEQNDDSKTNKQPDIALESVTTSKPTISP